MIGKAKFYRDQQTGTVNRRSGLSQQQPGRFALADGGTIFLDEIGDISPAMQARLLRVLQERTFEPLGSVEPVQVDVRVIAATNKDLAKLVRKGTFREDLFYRIHVIRIALPNLRDRREDIPLLIEHFIAKFNRLQGKDVLAVSLEGLLSESGIRVYGRVCGNVDEVLKAFVAGTLGSAQYAMPGCCGQARRRFRGGCHRGRHSQG